MLEKVLKTQIGIDMKILIKLMRLLYLKSNKTTPWFTIQEWKQSKDKTETDEWGF
jgi:hypothetical protein